MSILLSSLVPKGPPIRVRLELTHEEFEDFNLRP
jgi:hypothetical protein